MVEVGEVAAIEMIETGHGLARVVITEPPEPVGTFADRQLVFGGYRLFRREATAALNHVVTLFGGAEQIPGVVLFAVADPGRQSAIYPATGG